MRIFVLIVHTVPRVLLCAFLLLCAFAVHWLLGLLAAVVLIPAGLGFVGEYLDAIAQEPTQVDQSQKAVRQRLGYPQE